MVSYSKYIQKNTPSGTIGLSNIDKIERDCSFGIAIHPKFHNHKFGKRAIWIMLEYIFTDLDLDRVHLTVLENNEKAKKIYKSFGFSQEGIAPDPVLKNGKYFNLEILYCSDQTMQGRSKMNSYTQGQRRLSMPAIFRSKKSLKTFPVMLIEGTSLLF